MRLPGISCSGFATHSISYDHGRLLDDPMSERFIRCAHQSLLFDSTGHLRNAMSLFTKQAPE